MRKIVERSEARYETYEVPFGKSYKWQPAHIVLQCSCGEKVILTKASSATVIICRRCGAEHTGFVQDALEQEEEVRLPDTHSHPWLHDAQDRAQQHLRDEAVFPNYSPWHYNDITAGSAHEQREE